MPQDTSTPKTRKIKVPRVVNGIETYVEIEVDDTGGPAWGPRDAHTILNHWIDRVDGPAKVTGSARYTYDVRLPGLLVARVLRSPYAKADVLRIDTSRAERMPGVHAVFILPGKTRVNFEGDALGGVAAETPEAADDALRAIVVQYKPLPFVVTPEQAIAPNAPRVFEGPGSESLHGNVRPGSEEGDSAATEAALKTCPVVVEREFHVTMQHHTCLETHGHVVDYRGGDTATVYSSTQGTFTIPPDAAPELGLKDQNAVTAIVEYMGGGFGSKFGIGIEGKIACQLSKKAKAPVKLMLTRVDEYLMAGNRSGAWQRVRAGANTEGRLVAMWAHQFRLGGVDEGSQTGLPYIYSAEKHYHNIEALHTNQDATVAFRAPGHPEVSFAMESIMDDLAYRIPMDPVEFRKKNTDDPTYHRQLDLGAKAIGWEKRPAKPGAGPGYGPERALKRGMGCGCATWGGGGGPECKVDIFIKTDGAVAVQVGTQDLGTGSRTYTAAIVAEELGLPVAAVETRIGRSTYGAANASGGSTTTASLAPAVKSAAYNARKSLFVKVAPALGAKPEDLAAAGGKVYVATDPSKALTWKQACAALGSSGISAHGEWVAGLGGDGVHGAHFAEVEVDTHTGRVRVVKMVGVQDCGLPLNRAAIESQINGGMIQGLGYALLEETVADPTTGHMLNASMDDYKVPGCFEMPELVPLIDDGDTRNQVIGMAEPAIIPAAAAIANAVHSACGARITSLPITPDKILMALHRA